MYLEPVSFFELLVSCNPLLFTSKMLLILLSWCLFSVFSFNKKKSLHLYFGRWSTDLACEQRGSIILAKWIEKSELKKTELRTCCIGAYFERYISYSVGPSYLWTVYPRFRLIAVLKNTPKFNIHSQFSLFLRFYEGIRAKNGLRMIFSSIQCSLIIHVFSVRGSLQERIYHK